jgi:hypothetical protein
MATYNFVYTNDDFYVQSSNANATLALNGQGTFDEIAVHDYMFVGFTTNFVVSQSFNGYDTSAIPRARDEQSFFVYTNTDGATAPSSRIYVAEYAYANTDQPTRISHWRSHANLRYVHASALGNGIFTQGSNDRQTIFNEGIVPRTNIFRTIMYSANNLNANVPGGGINDWWAGRSSDAGGTTYDPYLLLLTGPIWQFVWCNAGADIVTTARHAITLNTTPLQVGDLLICSIASRIGSTTSITRPPLWNLVSENKTSSTVTTSSAVASGMLAYCTYNGVTPNVVFTHPVAPSVAVGRIFAFRGANTIPFDVATGFKTATNNTAVIGPGLTTTEDNELIVGMFAGGQEATITNINSTILLNANTSSDATGNINLNVWNKCSENTTTTGADTSLATFYAVKSNSGATGDLRMTASHGASHVVLAGAFKIMANTPAAADTNTGNVWIYTSDQNRWRAKGIKVWDGGNWVLKKARVRKGVNLWANSNAYFLNDDLTGQNTISLGAASNTQFFRNVQVGPNTHPSKYILICALSAGGEVVTHTSLNVNNSTANVTYLNAAPYLTGTQLVQSAWVYDVNTANSINIGLTCTNNSLYYGVFVYSLSRKPYYARAYHDQSTIMPVEVANTGNATIISGMASNVTSTPTVLYQNIQRGFVNTTVGAATLYYSSGISHNSSNFTANLKWSGGTTTQRTLCIYLSANN